MRQITHIHETLPYTFNANIKLPSGEIIQRQHVKGTSNKSYKVIYNGDTTIVILEDGSKGVSKRSKKDLYNIQIGHDIAHKRAKIESLKKEIEQISKSQQTKQRRLYTY